jgi:tetratricopeptide (TPR) repeat protein
MEVRPTQQTLMSLKHALTQANKLYSNGRLIEACNLYKSIIEQHPNVASAHNNLGAIYRDMGSYEKALEHFQRAIEIDPNHAGAHHNISVVLKSLMQMQLAEVSCRKSLKINPNDARVWNSLGNILRKLNRQEEAVICFKKAIFLDATYNRPWQCLTASMTFTSIEQPEAQEVIKRTQSLTPNDKYYIEFHFVLGKIYADCQKYEDSFKHFRLANNARRAKSSYNPKRIEASLTQIKSFFNKQLFEENLGFAGSDSSTPIFIVGMPRSGKTLLESMLAQDGSIHGAGELHTISEMVTTLSGEAGYPESVAALGQSQISMFSKRYLERLHAYAPKDAKRIIDTMPFNFLHVGLIHLLFPSAKIIHCQRNAVDCCLFNYFKHFAVGNEFSYDLDSLAHYYQHYKKIIQHWLDTLPEPILTVSYESLITDTQHTLNTVTEFLNVKSITASSALYNSEINISKHYAAFITSFNDKLA